MTASAFHNVFDGAEIAQPAKPLPLRREMPPGQAFPLDALGLVLGDAARAIIDRVQVPDAIAGQSVLGVASLAVQAHANVVIPATGHAKPISLFLVTVAASGERKSAADSEALRPIRLREEALRNQYADKLPRFVNAKAAYDKARDQILKTLKPDTRHEAQAKLDALGLPPAAPLTPMLTCSEPTLAGLHRYFMGGEPSAGLFSDEGGAFLGGNGMKEENRLLMATGLSGLWDGSVITRVRVEDGTTIMPGRRFAMHLMMQQLVAERLLSDPLLKEQGLLSRILVAAPPSLAGTRFQRPSDPRSAGALMAYTSHILNILERPQPRPDPDGNELEPRELRLSPEAVKMWEAFADEVELRIGHGAEWEPIKGFANKLPEHAARIAAVLQLVEAIDAPTVCADAMRRGIVLARFYAGEALRLFDAGTVPLSVQHAEKLLSWLHQKGHRLIGLKTIYQLGPTEIRTAKAARDAVAVLADHGWLVRLPSGATIDGDRHKEGWEVVRP